MTDVTSIVAAIVGDVSLDSAEGREAARLWAESHVPFAEAMASQGLTETESRAATRARFLSDLGIELPAAAVSAGMSPESMGHWITNDSEAEIAAAPFLGLMREVMDMRLRNPNERWEANDLVDMLFLCCAAAYADVVVAEKKTVGYLRRARKHSFGRARLCTSLAEAVAELGHANS